MESFDEFFYSIPLFGFNVRSSPPRRQLCIKMGRLLVLKKWRNSWLSRIIPLFSRNFISVNILISEDVGDYFRCRSKAIEGRSILVIGGDRNRHVRLRIPSYRLMATGDQKWERKVKVNDHHRTPWRFIFQLKNNFMFILEMSMVTSMWALADLSQSFCFVGDDCRTTHGFKIYPAVLGFFDFNTK